MLLVRPLDAPPAGRRLQEKLVRLQRFYRIDEVRASRGQRAREKATPATIRDAFIRRARQ
jgi:hypothetical protein